MPGGAEQKRTPTPPVTEQRPPTPRVEEGLRRDNLHESRKVATTILQIGEWGGRFWSTLTEVHIPEVSEKDIVRPLALTKGVEVENLVYYMGGSKSEKDW